MPEMPVKLELGLLGVVTTPPAPDTIDHDPTPMLGVFAKSVAEVAHTAWSGPAFAVVGFGVKMISTSSEDATQGAFEIVQRKI